MSVEEEVGKAYDRVVEKLGEEKVHELAESFLDAKLTTTLTGNDLGNLVILFELASAYLSVAGDVGLHEEFYSDAPDLLDRLKNEFLNVSAAAREMVGLE